MSRKIHWENPERNLLEATGRDTTLPDANVFPYFSLGICQNPSWFIYFPPCQQLELFQS